MNGQQLTMISKVEKYFYQVLKNSSSKQIVIQTTKNTLQGVLKQTMLDHLVVEVRGVPFYVESSEIVWVMFR